MLMMIACMALACGCVAHPKSAQVEPIPTTAPTTQGLSRARFLESVDATVAPPDGWIEQPLKKSSRHTHQLWISPTDKTAFGVMHFGLPFPVGHEPVLWFFLKEMKRQQGAADLLSKQWDPKLRGVRFVASGGMYTIRTNLVVHAWEGWIVYAGTLREGPVDEKELALAESAREHTVLGQEEKSK
jgi:hypothetical protein